MLSGEEDVQAQALRQQGWSISAIARQVDRKTVRAYLSGEREPGKRRRSQPTLIEPGAGVGLLRVVVAGLGDEDGFEVPAVFVVRTFRAFRACRAVTGVWNMSGPA